MKALLLIFSLILILLLAGLWVGPGSYPDRWKLNERTSVLALENDTKKEEIKKIRAELDDVSSSNDALEERARSELGMTKKGETFFEVIMQPKDPSNSQHTSESTHAIIEKDGVKKPSINNSEN